jgi:hypothetical protein
MEGLMNWWLLWNQEGSPKPTEAPAQQNPVVGIWRGSAFVSGITINEEFVFQPNLLFDQQTTYSMGGMIQRSGTYKVALGPQPDTGQISLHTLRHSQGIMLDDVIPFRFRGPNTLMMWLPAPNDWVPYQRCG